MVDINTSIEKISNLLFFLPLISLALFVDMYLVYNYDVAIWQIDFEWLKAHTTSSEIVSFIILFVLLYLVAMPLLHRVSILVLRLAYLSLPPRMIFSSRYLDNSTYIPLN